MEFKAIIMVNGTEFDYFTLNAENVFDASVKAEKRVSNAYPHLIGKCSIICEEV